MQGAMRKIEGTLAAVMLSLSCCLFPYSQAAYANILAFEYMGQALIAVMAVLGVAPAMTDGAIDYAAIGESYSSFMDGMAEAGADVLKSATASWDKTLTQDIDWNAVGDYAEQSKNAVLAWGKAGIVNLNELSMAGAFGLLPAFLSLFIAQQVGSGTDVTPGDVVGAITVGGVEMPINVTSDDLSFGVEPLEGKGVGVRYYTGTRYEAMVAVLNVNPVEMGHVGVSLRIDDRGWYIQSISGSTFIDDQLYYLSSSNRYFGTNHGTVEQWWGNGANTGFYVQNVSELVFSTYAVIRVSYNGTVLGNYVTSSGIWYGDEGVWTDNPDVIGGSDYWDDARENKDILNPSAGAAVIGSDAVFDGDYIANRGSITIPTDWSGINSWADALGATHAGVAQGALDGTISGTSAGTAVDVGTGELVNGNVSDLTKPGSNTSIALPLPGLFDGVVDAVSDKFPFCIPGDLYQCLAALSAAPVAPAFDWTFALSHVGLHDVTIRVDLAEFDQVAFILRVGLSVTMTIGLVFLSTRLLNMWGGD